MKFIGVCQALLMALSWHSREAPGLSITAITVMLVTVYAFHLWQNLLYHDEPRPGINALHLKYFLGTYFLCICYLQAYRMFKESRLESWLKTKWAGYQAKVEEERLKEEEEAEKEAEEERQWLARSHADLSIDVTLEDENDGEDEDDVALTFQTGTVTQETQD